jgi:cobalamin biosynthesis protein CobT
MLYDKIINIKDQSKVEINNLVNKVENKFFGNINNILNEICEDENNENNENENNKSENNENNENENNENENNKNENENKNENNENKQNENQNKNENNVEFNKFDKNVNKIIKKNFKELKNKLVKVSYNLDTQVKDYLTIKFSGEIKKENFDNFFNYIENLKTKKDNFFKNSKKI